MWCRRRRTRRTNSQWGDDPANFKGLLKGIKITNEETDVGKRNRKRSPRDDVDDQIGDANAQQTMVDSQAWTLRFNLSDQYYNNWPTTIEEVEEDTGYDEEIVLDFWGFVVEESSVQGGQGVAGEDWE